MQTAQRSPRTVIADRPAEVDRYHRQQAWAPRVVRHGLSSLVDHQGPSRKSQAPLVHPIPSQQQACQLTLPRETALLPQTPPLQLELNVEDQRLVQR